MHPLMQLSASEWLESRKGVGEMEAKVYVNYVQGLSQWHIDESDDMPSVLSARSRSVGVSTKTKNFKVS